MDIRSEIEVVAGDIRDSQCVRQAIKGCDVVYHLAALISIPYSYRSAESYFDTNVKGTLNVVQAARDFGVRKVVHTSTSEVYGTARFVPINESHPIHPQSPYAASKAGADHLAMSFHDSFGVPVSVVRPFNAYGPRQSARAVIPAIITQIAGGGRTIRLGALHPTRDFTFIQDTVHGFLAAGQSAGSVGEVVNIGSQFEISIGETAQTIARLMKADIEILPDPERMRPASGEVLRLFADRGKAESLIGWEPRYGGKEGFARGLAETIDWFSYPANLNRYKQGVYQV